jgi:predicted 3-demethylubiquinone-9 3-methyltransferase (glyoxalase superfamily)
MSTHGMVTCLWFDGQAEQAAQHYVSIFKDGRVGRVSHHGDEPGRALTVEFEVNGQRFVGLNGGPRFRFDEAISFQVLCADQAEVDHYWDALVEGGEESQCGWLKDRFGLSWQIVPSELIDLLHTPEPAKVERMMQEMYTMRRLDIARLRRAYEGS